MTRTVKSAKDLETLALSKGATLKRGDGSLFNSNKRKATGKKAPPPKAAKPVPEKPAPAPPPPPAPPVDPRIGDIAQSLAASMAATRDVLDLILRQSGGANEEIARSLDANTAVMRDLLDQIKKQMIGPNNNIKEWKFEIDRDRDGYMATVTATATRPN